MNQEIIDDLAAEHATRYYKKPTSPLDDDNRWWAGYTGYKDGFEDGYEKGYLQGLKDAKHLPENPSE